MDVGRYGLERCAVRSIRPPNFCGGAGISSPGTVVALGDSGVPMIRCTGTGAAAGPARARKPGLTAG